MRLYARFFFHLALHQSFATMCFSFLQRRQSLASMASRSRAIFSLCRSRKNNRLLSSRSLAWNLLTFLWMPRQNLNETAACRLWRSLGLSVSGSNSWMACSSWLDSLDSLGGISASMAAAWLVWLAASMAFAKVSNTTSTAATTICMADTAMLEHCVSDWDAIPCRPLSIPYAIWRTKSCCLNVIAAGMGRGQMNAPAERILPAVSIAMYIGVTTPLSIPGVPLLYVPFFEKELYGVIVSFKAFQNKRNWWCSQLVVIGRKLICYIADCINSSFGYIANWLQQWLVT